MAQEANKQATGVDFHYNVGEKCYAIYADRKWYPVVIRDRNVDKHPETGAGSATYLVHYNGWNERFNEWMLEDCLMRADEKGDKEAREENERVSAESKPPSKLQPKKGTKKVPRSRGKTMKIGGEGTPAAASRSESVVSESASDAVDGKLSTSGKRQGKDLSQAPVPPPRPTRTAAGGKKAKTQTATAGATAASTSAINSASSASDSHTPSPPPAEEHDALKATMVPPTSSAGGSGSITGLTKDDAGQSAEVNTNAASSITTPAAGVGTTRRGSARRAAALTLPQTGTSAEPVVARVKSPPTTPLTAFADTSLASPAVSISAASDVKTNEDSGSVNTALSAPFMPTTPMPKSSRKGGRVQLLAAATANTAITSATGPGGKSTTSSGSAASSVSGTATASDIASKQQQINRSVSQRRPSAATTPLTSPPVASPASAPAFDSLVDPASDAVRAEARHYFEIAAKSYLYPEPSENVWLVMNALPEIFNEQNSQLAQRYLTEWRVRRGAYLDAIKDAKQYQLSVPESVQQMMLQDYMQIVYQQKVWSARDSVFSMQAVLSDYKSYLDESVDTSDAASVEWYELASSMILDVQEEAKAMCESLFSHHKVNNDMNDEEHSIFIMHEVFHMISAMRKKKPVFDLTDLGVPHLVRLLHQMVHCINVCTDVRGNNEGRFADLQFAHLQAIMNFLGEQGVGTALEVVRQVDKLYADRTTTGGDKTDVKVRELFYSSDRLPINTVYDISATEVKSEAPPPPLKGVFFVESELSLVDVDDTAQTNVESCFGKEAAGGEEVGLSDIKTVEQGAEVDDAARWTVDKESSSSNLQTAPETLVKNDGVLKHYVDTSDSSAAIVSVV